MTTNPAHSPIAVSQPVTMAFPDALHAVMGGDRITRIEWHDNGVFVFLQDGILRIMTRDGVHNLIVSDGDLFATDWVIA